MWVCLFILVDYTSFEATSSQINFTFWGLTMQKNAVKGQTIHRYHYYEEIPTICEKCKRKYWWIVETYNESFVAISLK
jgi:hypothetical protein